MKRWVDRISEHPWSALWVLLAYLPFLGSMSVPLTGDQKVYISTALEMEQQSSWLQPLLFGAPSYYKPPFQYWMSVLSWKFFGHNHWATMIPSVLALVATAWLIGEIAKLLFPRVGAKTYAPLLLAGSLGSATYGATAQMEIYVILFFAAQWYLGLRFLSSPKNTRDYRLLNWAFILSGISALVKSPLYSIFWVLSFASYLLLNREWTLLKDRKLYLGLFYGILASIPWYAYILIKDGDHFWADYAMRETWEKKNGNQSSPLSLWLALLYFCLPFTLLLVPAFKNLLEKQHRRSRLAQFALAWAWPPAIFFTLYPYRIKPYLYCLVPVVCLIVDWHFLTQARDKLHDICAKIGAVMIGGVIIVIALLLVRADMIPFFLAVALAYVGGLLLSSTWKKQINLSVLAGLLLVTLLHGTATSIGEADIQGLRKYIQENPQHRYAMLDENHNIWHEIGLVSIGSGRLFERLYNWDDCARFLRDGGVLVLSDGQSEQISSGLEPRLALLAPGKTLIQTHWQRWKVRSAFPFSDVLLKGSSGIPDWNDRVMRKFRILKLI